MFEELFKRLGDIRVEDGATPPRATRRSCSPSSTFPRSSPPSGRADGRRRRPARADPRRRAPPDGRAGLGRRLDAPAGGRLRAATSRRSTTTSRRRPTCSSPSCASGATASGWRSTRRRSIRPSPPARAARRAPRLALGQRARGAGGVAPARRRGRARRGGGHPGRRRGRRPARDARSRSWLSTGFPERRRRPGRAGAGHPRAGVRAGGRAPRPRRRDHRASPTSAPRSWPRSSCPQAESSSRRSATAPALSTAAMPRSCEPGRRCGGAGRRRRRSG